MLLGAWLAARYGEEYNIPRDTTYSLAMRMVVVGVIGSRITWVLSHLDEIESPVDVIAIWEGGLQFSGGFVFAVIAGYPVYRHWNRLTRWHSLDGYAYGLSHRARHRSHRLLRGRRALRLAHVVPARRSATTAAACARSSSAPSRSQPGMVFHQTALYELIYMVVLFVILSVVLYVRKPRPGPGRRDGDLHRLLRRGALRCPTSLRVNDETLLGLTGAQYLCLALLPTSAWIWFRVRKQLAAGRRGRHARGHHALS